MCHLKEIKMVNWQFSPLFSPIFLFFLPEEEQKMNPPNNYKLQANNTDDNRTKSKFPPGSLPSSEEESLAEVDLEKYMAVVDSLKVPYYIL